MRFNINKLWIIIVLLCLWCIFKASFLTFNTPETENVHQPSLMSSRSLDYSSHRRNNLDNCCLSRKKPNVISPFTSSCGNNCEQFGTKYGGRQLPIKICGLHRNLTIFSFGCGEDISFDVAMAATFDAKL